MPAKIPATVITGFLGAGKTTMIRHLLSNANGRRIALVINEFGDLGIDAGILQGCGDITCRDGDMIELANGCICCTVADEFVPTMKTLIERDEKPDHIVIETSGLALPQPLVRAFNWPDVRNALTVDGVVTVIDGAALAEGRFAFDETLLERQRQADDTIDHETPLAELFEDQLACADLVVLNKSDLLSDDARAKLSEDLKARLRPGVKLLHGRHGAIDADILLGMNMAAEATLAERAEKHHLHDDDHDDDDDQHHHEHAHGHDEFASFIVDLPEIASSDVLSTKVEALARQHDVLRVKGFASVSGKPMRLVLQAVGTRVDSYFDRRLTDDERGRSRLVVIGLHDMDRVAIEAALRA